MKKSYWKILIIIAVIFDVCCRFVIRKNLNLNISNDQSIQLLKITNFTRAIEKFNNIIFIFVIFLSVFNIILEKNKIKKIFENIVILIIIMYFKSSFISFDLSAGFEMVTKLEFWSSIIALIITITTLLIQIIEILERRRIKCQK